ncbi:hypothetical protein DM02DRAFT_543740 [Periconia macrospinosa]|uniref:Heterokaryon incompatibility domain-containing protein n=1 Tax=Periconia macrospinosa TaxID=97972 RepID=A0A2V1D4I7_9PLEO|nr:hypothetical protein DM02DRAFT_543740 [Periconia macrospinosa]
MTNNNMYSPLKSRGRTIRLLTVHPGRFLNDPIDATLIETTIEQAARNGYTTISYTWGSIDTNRQWLIQCNGIQYSISNNLYNVLRRLRRPDVPILVWADALCINQADLAERTHQVGLMGEIYKNSSETAIWLGEPAIDDDMCRRFFHCISQENLASVLRGGPPRIAWHGDSRDRKFLREYLSTLRDTWEESATQDDVFGAFCLIQSIAEGTSAPLFKRFEIRRNTENPFIGVESKAAGILGGLRRLIRASWWKRIWVIQETVLAQKATVHFGMLSAPWSMFATAAACWTRDHHSLCLDLSGTFQGHDVLNQFSNAVLQIDATRNDHQNSATGSTLLSLLWKFRPLEASDKRDKVYALIGLTTNWQRRPPMEPNYNIDTGTVFLRTSVNNIHRHQCLTVLAGDLEATLNRKRISGLPSWVMDWSLPCLPQEIDRVASLGIYNASGGRCGPVRLHKQEPILEIEGVYVDSIIAVGNVSRHTQISDTHAVIREWDWMWRAQEHKRRSASYPLTRGGTYQDAFWRTLIGDQVQVATDSKGLRHRRATPDDESSFRSWYMWLRCILRDTLDRRAFFSERDLAEGIASIHYALKTATASRRFFITREGFMGIGPKTTEPGDVVYVVKNSHVPFVLRHALDRECGRGSQWQTLIGGGGGGTAKPEDRKSRKLSACYRLVGDCFVHGAMDGQFFRKGDEEVVDKVYLI